MDLKLVRRSCGLPLAAFATVLAARAGAQQPAPPPSPVDDPTALAAVLTTLDGAVSYPHQFITKDTQVLGAPGEAPRTVTSPQSDYLNGSLAFQQSVINLQAWHSIKKGKENEKAARLSVADSQRMVTLGVATSIVGVVAAERVAELNRIGLRSALGRRGLTSKKRTLGVGAGLDVVRADQDVASAREAIVSGDEALRKSREALGLAVGVPEVELALREFEVVRARLEALFSLAPCDSGQATAQ